MAKKIKKGGKTGKKLTASKRTITKRIEGLEEENDIRKKFEFRTFVIWSAMPRTLATQPANVMQALGIGDQEALELLAIKNKKEFAIRYKVDEHTLIDWEKVIDEDGMLAQERQKFAKKLIANGVMAVYRKFLIEGDAARFTAP